jgi:hypothetical protein
MNKKTREEIKQVKTWLMEAEQQESESIFRIVRLYAIPLLEALENMK